MIEKPKVKMIKKPIFFKTFKTQRDFKTQIQND